MPRPSATAPRMWWFLPYVVASVVHVIALAADSPLAPPTKLLLMPLLMLPIVAFAVGHRSTSNSAQTPLILLGVAILFSYLGDGAGTFFPGAPTLPLMLAFFGIAHIAYITLFWRHLRTRPWHPLALVFAVWWIAMIAILGPHTGPLLVAVAAYGLVLGTTAALAARCNPVILVGGLFFLASDTILAFRLFLPEAMPHWTSPAVMLTYTVGQGLLVGGSLLALHRKDARA